MKAQKAERAHLRVERPAGGRDEGRVQEDKGFSGPRKDAKIAKEAGPIRFVIPSVTPAILEVVISASSPRAYCVAGASWVEV